MSRLTIPQRQFLGFVSVSGIAAVINFFSRIAFNLWVPYVPAIVLAFGVGLVTAFAMNRKYVFRQASRHLRYQAFWFATVNLLALAQTLAVSLLLVEVVFPHIGFAWHAETLAHAVGVTAPVFTSYLGHKHLSFR